MNFHWNFYQAVASWEAFPKNPPGLLFMALLFAFPMFHLKLNTAYPRVGSVGESTTTSHFDDLQRWFWGNWWIYFGRFQKSWNNTHKTDQVSSENSSYAWWRHPGLTTFIIILYGKFNGSVNFPKLNAEGMEKTEAIESLALKRSFCIFFGILSVFLVNRFVMPHLARRDLRVMISRSLHLTSEVRDLQRCRWNFWNFHEIFWWFS